MMQLFGIGYNSLLKLVHTKLPQQLSFFFSFSSAGKNPLPPLIKPNTSPMDQALFRQWELTDTKIFEQLRAEEKKQFPSKRRKRSTYDKNKSAAMSLPFTNELLDAQYGDQNALLGLVKNNIIEHANRRVDLYFYTLIAYANLGIHVARGRTVVQHGKGRTTKKNGGITQACHSSILPSLVDELIYQNSGKNEKKKSILHGTHFSESLSSTMELPPFVNDFDCTLENMGRYKSEQILAHVSLGDFSPIEGLTLFLQMMRDTLFDLQDKASRKKPSVLSSQSIMRQHHLNPNLIDLVIQGTLGTTFCTESQSAAESYICLILGIKPEEMALCKNQDDQKEALFLKKILSIQNEILTAKSEPSTQAKPNK